MQILSVTMFVGGVFYKMDMKENLIQELKLLKVKEEMFLTQIQKRELMSSHIIKGLSEDKKRLLERQEEIRDVLPRTLPDYIRHNLECSADQIQSSINSISRMVSEEKKSCFSETNRLKYNLVEVQEAMKRIVRKLNQFEG